MVPFIKKFLSLCAPVGFTPYSDEAVTGLYSEPDESCGSALLHSGMRLKFYIALIFPLPSSLRLHMVLHFVT